MCMDITDTDGEAETCADCGQPMHYDEAIEDYQHDDPDAPDCFLIRRRVAEPCSYSTVFAGERWCDTHDSAAPCPLDRSGLVVS